MSKEKDFQEKIEKGFFIAYRGNRYGPFKSRQKAEDFGCKMRIEKESICGQHYPFLLLVGIAIIKNKKLCFGSDIRTIDEF